MGPASGDERGQGDKAKFSPKGALPGVAKGPREVRRQEGKVELAEEQPLQGQGLSWICQCPIRALFAIWVPQLL